MTKSIVLRRRLACGCAGAANSVNAKVEQQKTATMSLENRMKTTVAVTSSGEIHEGQLCQVKVAGKPVLLSRVNGKVCAFSAKCPHIGLSLAKGTVADGTIRCPWHGSRFDMLTGANLDWTNAFAGISMPQWSHGLLSMGKKPAPLTLLEAFEQDGSVLITVPET